MKFEALAKDFNELRAHKAQDDLRRATVPADANGYNTTIPETVEWPKTAKGEVVKYDIAADDPTLIGFKNLAHKFGMPQEHLTEMLSYYAVTRASEDAGYGNMRAEQQAKLGANGPARVDATTRVLHAKLGAEKGQAIMDRMQLSSDFEALEDLVKLINTGGNSSITQLHREKPDNQLSEDEYNALSPAERRARTLRKAS